MKTIVYVRDTVNIGSMTNQYQEVVNAFIVSSSNVDVDVGAASKIGMWIDKTFYPPNSIIKFVRG